MKPSKNLFLLFLILLSTLLGCASDEQKKASYLDKGKAYYEKGDYRSAILEFKNAVQIDPKYSDAHYMIGLTELKLKNFQEAFNSFTLAVKHSPDNLNAQLELGKLFLASKAFDKALATADFILSSDLENREEVLRDALLLKGSSLIAGKKIKEATEFLEQVLEKGVTYPDLYLMLFSLHARNNDIKSAVKVLENGVKANPESVAIYAALFNVYTRYGPAKNAEATMKKMIALEPDRVTHKISLANLYWNSGRRDEASTLLQKIISSDPGNEDNIMHLARFYISKRQIADAENMIKSGIKNNKKSIKLRLLLSRLYASLKQTDMALEILKESLALEKDSSSHRSIQFKNALARIYLSTGDIEHAEKYIDEALKDSPKNVESHFNNGVISLYKGAIEKSVSEFNIVLKENPSFIPGYIYLARAHIENQDLTKAEVTLWKGLKIRPNSRKLLKAYSFVFILKKDFTEAATQLKKIIKNNPRDIQVIANLGDIYLAQHDFDQAKNEYEKIKQNSPKTPLGYLKLSGLYAKKGEFAKAVSELEAGCEANPESKTLMLNLIQGYLSQKKYDAAIALLSKRIKQKFEQAFYHNLLGQVYVAQKNYVEAEKAFKEAITSAPMWQSPYNSLSRLYLIQGKEKYAIQTFESKIAANPKNPAGYISLGLIYEVTEKYGKAVEIYEKALEVNPNLWVVANNLSYLLCEYFDSESNLEKALELANKAYQIMPNNPSVLDTLGWVHYKKGDTNRAIGFMKKASFRMPENVVLNYHLGMALYKINKLEDSLKRLEKALASKENFQGRKEAQKTRELILAAVKSNEKVTSAHHMAESDFIKDDVGSGDELDDIFNNPFEKKE